MHPSLLGFKIHGVTAILASHDKIEEQGLNCLRIWIQLYDLAWKWLPIPNKYSPTNSSGNLRDKDEVGGISLSPSYFTLSHFCTSCTGQLLECVGPSQLNSPESTLLSSPVVFLDLTATSYHLYMTLPSQSIELTPLNHNNEMKKELITPIFLWSYCRFG